MLITPEYLAQQKKLHKGIYGLSAWKWAERIKHHQDILDYGCGKRSLEAELGRPIANYDPCITGLENNNQPHDFVFCGDVLEHIEPTLLDNVLQDIKRCMKKEGLFIISTVKAGKSLPDGRNAHLIVEDHKWWRTELTKYFVIDKEEIEPKQYIVEVSNGSR